MVFFSLFTALVVTAGLVECRQYAQVSKGAPSGTWIDLFSPPYTQCPSTMVGISCVSSTACYIPGGSNGVGFDVYLFDGQVNGDFTPLNMPSMELMSLGIAMGGTDANPHGCVGGIGIGNGVQYAVNATTFEPSYIPTFFVVTQDIRAANGGMLVLVMDNANNVALFSSNGGISFSEFNVTSPIPNGAFVRYGAIASKTTWYMTFGDWPNNQWKGRTDVVSINARLARHRKTGKIVRADVLSRIRSGSGDNGYSAAIVKTSDGGKTWTTQFSDTTNYFYFNAIDCRGTSICVAVGEGFDTNAAAHIYRTANGGATWTQVMVQPSNSSAAFSLMSVMFVTATEVWAAGSVQGEFTSSSLFYFSTDAGQTWTMTSGLPNIGDITDLSFTPSGAGFATAVTIYDDSTVLGYFTGPVPTPVPGAPPTSFTQMDCSDAACSQGCQNATFPTDSCLPVNGGGSAIVQCSATALLQSYYPNSQDCTGASQNQSMPLNQCLQSSSGGYFENFCPPGMFRLS